VTEKNSLIASEQHNRASWMPEPRAPDLCLGKQVRSRSEHRVRTDSEYNDERTHARWACVCAVGACVCAGGVGRDVN
jgi:hypothetical protein